MNVYSAPLALAHSSYRANDFGSTELFRLETDSPKSSLEIIIGDFDVVISIHCCVFNISVCFMLLMD